MSTSNNSQQELRERRSTSRSKSNSKSKENNKDIEQEEEQTNEIVVPSEQEEIVKLPSANSNLDDEPTALTKDNLLSLFIVMFSVFLDFMGVSIVQPILPFYAEVFGASSLELGALYSSYSGMSLLASLFMGRCSDSFGRKPMILFSLFGTCLGFLCCGLANNYGQLLAFRFLTGLFGATSPVAMAYIADVVPSGSRPKYLAATGAVISLAFIMGPGLGSGLAEFGIRVPFFVSSGLGAFGFIFALISLKESHPTVLKKRALKKQADIIKKKNLKSVSMADNDDEAEMENMNTPRTDEDDDDLDEMDTIKIVDEGDRTEIDGNDSINSKIPPQVFVLCTVNMLNSLGFTTYSSMFTLYVIDLYDLDSLSIGYITLCGAVMTVFGNVFFVNISKYIGMYISTTGGCLMFGTALLLIPILSNVWAIIAMVVFGIGLGYGQIMPAMSSTVASFTNVKNRGTILGFSSVASNIAFIVGPLLCGFVYEFNKGYPFYIGAASVFIAAIIVIMMICKWPELGIPNKVKDDDDESAVIDKDWKFTADKFTKKDYMRLGKAFGTMMANKHYNWKSHFDLTLKCLDTVFPPLRIDTREHLAEDVKFILDNAREVRGQFDELHFGLTAMKI